MDEPQMDPSSLGEPPLVDPCTDALQSLYTYLDGELTTERRGLISRHLDECHSCLGAHDFEAELRKVVSSSCQDTVPDSLRDRIAQQLEGEASS